MESSLYDEESVVASALSNAAGKSVGKGKKRSRNPLCKYAYTTIVGVGVDVSVGTVEKLRYCFVGGLRKWWCFFFSAGT